MRDRNMAALDAARRILIPHRGTYPIPTRDMIRMRFASMRHPSYVGPLSPPNWMRPRVRT